MNFDNTVNKEKERISSMFSAIVPRYDLLNRLMSLGMDGSWRKKMVQLLELSPGNKVIDICAGTGDVVLEMLRQVPQLSAVVVDFSPEMLEVTQQKAQKRKLQERIECKVEDATALSFSDNSFDGASMAFGLRNVEDATKGVAEMLRVIRPGKRAVILEFSKPSNPVLRLGSRIYMSFAAPLLGSLLSEGFAYRYLSASVVEFTENVNVVKLMEKVGFEGVVQKPLFLGIVSLYRGKKPEKGV